MVYLPPYFLHRLTLVGEDLSLNVVSFQLYDMPGDPAILQGVPTTLSATDLLNNVAVKLPLFWPDNIETWFVQAKSQFRLRAVTITQTKFD